MYIQTNRQQSLNEKRVIEVGKRGKGRRVIEEIKGTPKIQGEKSKNSSLPNEKEIQNQEGERNPPVPRFEFQKILAERRFNAIAVRVGPRD